jgi:hypothetical protein
MVMATQATTRGTIIVSMRMPATTQCIGIIDHITLTQGLSHDIDFMVLSSQDFTSLLRSRPIGRFTGPLRSQPIGRFTGPLRSQRIGHFSEALRTGVHVSRARCSAATATGKGRYANHTHE